MRPLCSIPRCTSPRGRLPDYLEFLGIELCPTHITHLTQVRLSALCTLDDDSFADLAVLREAQGLVHPSGAGTLTVLEGGR